MNHPIPYASNGSDLIKWFSGYYKNKFGYYLPDSQWQKQAAFIRYMRNQDYDLEDIATLVWGHSLQNKKMQSMWYAKDFTDKLDEYKELKKKYIEKENKQEKEVEYDETQFKENKKLDAKEYFEEFFE
jgi:hypothetical protein